MMDRLVAIDFETANRDPASVCSVGVSVMEDGMVESALETLIRPEPNVSFFLRGNTAIHGIRYEDVRTAPSFAEVYRKMRPLLEGSLVAAHNARFDMTCMKEACRNCGIVCPPLAYFDTVELSRVAFPYLEHHRLNDLCDYLGIELDHHRAGSDAYGCLLIVARVMTMTGIYDIEELLRQCRIRIHTL